MTDQNRTNQEQDKAERANAPHVQEQAQREATELKSDQQRAADAKAEQDQRMAQEARQIHGTNSETSPEQAGQQTRADEKADHKDALTKKAESRELDKELEDSMDGSDPPSVTQP